MKEELTAPEKKASALAILAGRLNLDPAKCLDALKKTVFKEASNEELLVLTVVANEYGLNPLVKELYAFPAKGGGIVPVVSVDGWLRITNDHPQMDGLETAFADTPSGEPISCTCTIYRKDRAHPIVVTEYLAECIRNTEPWKMKHRMLRHKAIIQCARVAFGFAGIHDEEEARDIVERVAKGRTVTAVERPADPFATQDEPFALENADTVPSALDTLEQRAMERGWDEDRLWQILVNNKMTDAEYPADLTESEAQAILSPTSWGPLCELMEGIADKC